MAGILLLVVVLMFGLLLSLVFACSTGSRAGVWWGQRLQGFVLGCEWWPARLAMSMSLEMSTILLLSQCNPQLDTVPGLPCRTAGGQVATELVSVLQPISIPGTMTYPCLYVTQHFLLLLLPLQVWKLVSQT